MGDSGTEGQGTLGTEAELEQSRGPARRRGEGSVTGATPRLPRAPTNGRTAALRAPRTA